MQNFKLCIKKSHVRANGFTTVSCVRAANTSLRAIIALQILFKNKCDGSCHFCSLSRVLNRILSCCSDFHFDITLAMSWISQEFVNWEIEIIVYQCRYPVGGCEALSRSLDNAVKRAGWWCAIPLMFCLCKLSPLSFKLSLVNTSFSKVARSHCPDQTCPGVPVDVTKRGY